MVAYWFSYLGSERMRLSHRAIVGQAEKVLKYIGEVSSGVTGYAWMVGGGYGIPEFNVVRII